MSLPTITIKEKITARRLITRKLVTNNLTLTTVNGIPVEGINVPSNLPRGPTGPTGDSPQGPFGPNGKFTNVIGPTGPTGLPSDTVTGPTGITIIGSTGPINVTGPTGPRGINSMTGPTGMFSGTTGATGTRGLLSLTGTANQITVTPSNSNTVFTVSTPQRLNIGSLVQFNNIYIGDKSPAPVQTGSGNFLVESQIICNGLTGGQLLCVDSSKNLRSVTLSNNFTVNANQLNTSQNPTFTSLVVGANGPTGSIVGNDGRISNVLSRYKTGSVSTTVTITNNIQSQSRTINVYYTIIGNTCSVGFSPLSGVNLFTNVANPFQITGTLPVFLRPNPVSGGAPCAIMINILNNNVAQEISGSIEINPATGVFTIYPIFSNNIQTTTGLFTSSGGWKNQIFFTYLLN
jgi:hypothetical protein